MVHVGHHRRNAADDRIVELIDALPRPETALVYTSDAGLRARVHELGAQVAGARALLDAIAALCDEVQAKAGSLSTEPSLDAPSSFRWNTAAGQARIPTFVKADPFRLGDQSPGEEPAEMRDAGFR